MSVPSVDEGDGPDAEIGGAGDTPGALDAVPDHAGEVAGDRPGDSASGDRAAGGVRLEMEADPADHVVLRVRAAAGQGVVDGEEKFGADAGLERVLDRLVVPLRSGV